MWDGWKRAKGGKIWDNYNRITIKNDNKLKLNSRSLLSNRKFLFLSLIVQFRKHPIPAPGLGGHKPSLGSLHD